MKNKFSGILLVLTLMGCATTPHVGHFLHADKVALVKAGLIRRNISAFSITSEYLNIKFLDGLQLKEGRVEQLEINPGKHVLEVTRVHKICVYFKCKYGPDQFGALSFIAEAGKIYVVKSKEKNDILFFWLEDEGSREIVSSQKPPNDDPPVSD